MDINSARIEVLLEEITRQVKSFHDSYSDALSNIDDWSRTSLVNPDELYRLMHDATLMSTRSAIQLVNNQINLSTEESRKPYYQAQLQGIQESLENALEIPLKMKQVKSDTHGNGNARK